MTAAAAFPDVQRRNQVTGNMFTISNGGWTGYRAALGASCECGAWHEATTPITAPDISFASFEGPLDDALSDLLAECREMCGS